MIYGQDTTLSSNGYEAVGPTRLIFHPASHPSQNSQDQRRRVWLRCNQPKLMGSTPSQSSGASLLNISPWLSQFRQLQAIRKSPSSPPWLSCPPSSSFSSSLASPFRPRPVETISGCPQKLRDSSAEMVGMFLITMTWHRVPDGRFWLPDLMATGITGIR